MSNTKMYFLTLLDLTDVCPLLTKAVHTGWITNPMHVMQLFK
jgi:hypothetical protein